MKKIITLITITVTSLLMLTGCESIKKWWSDLSLTDVATTLSPSLKAASKYGVYAVCDKNKDLTNIFIASANGVKAAIAASSYDTTTIKEYIAKALGEENSKWKDVVYSAMDTVLAQYNIIYNKYINKELEANDKANGFKIMLTSIMDGIIEGASMVNTIQSDGMSIDQKLKLANEELKLKVSNL